MLPALWEDVETADWLHLTDGEEVRWTGRPSRFTIAVAIVGGLVLALAGIALAVWLRPRVAAAAVPAWVGYLPLVFTAVGLGWAGAVYLDWLRLLYVITDEVIYVKYGLVSRDVTQIRLDRVQNTAFDQTVLRRLLRYGDVRVYTAGTATEDITLQGVPNPEQVCQLLTVVLADRVVDERGDVHYRASDADGEYADGV